MFRSFQLIRRFQLMSVPVTKQATVPEAVMLNTKATSRNTFRRRTTTEFRQLQTTTVAAAAAAAVGSPKGKKRVQYTEPTPPTRRRRRQVQQNDNYAKISNTTAGTDETIIAEERQEVEEHEELTDQTITTADDGNDNERCVPTTTKRTLPKTFLSLTPTSKTTPLSSAPQSNDVEVFKPNLPNIQYPQHYTVTCSSDPHEMNAQLVNLLSKNEVVFGLDLEWQPQFKKGLPQHKTALIQICGSDTILLFQVARLQTLPTELVRFLKNKSIFKAGVNIKGDGQKLSRDFKVSTNGLVELQLMTQHIDSPLLMQTNKRSLSALTSLFLEMNMPKSKSVRLSNWSKPNLTPKQMLYAACDAYASYKLCILFRDMLLQQNKSHITSFILHLAQDQTTSATAETKAIEKEAPSSSSTATAAAAASSSLPPASSSSSSSMKPTHSTKPESNKAYPTSTTTIIRRKIN